MESRGLELLGHTDLEGRGDAAGLAVLGDLAYVGHKGRHGVATSIVDLSDPRRPRVVRQLPADPGTHSPKVAVGGGLLLTNCERDLVWEGPPFVRPVGGAERWTAGLRIYDLSDPTTPEEVGLFPVEGDGVHRMTFVEPPLAFLSASDAGYTDQFLRVVDLSDPASPREVGRWWYPGMWTEGGERPRFPEGRRYALHHAIPRGDLLFCGWWDAGLVVLDVGDPSRPQLVANLNWGPGESGATHTALPLPGRDLLVVTDEAIVEGCRDIPKQVRVLDVADPYSPRLLSTLPVPEGDFCDRGGRFGPHNLAEPQEGLGVDPRIVCVTYFNAGVRVVDLSDPEGPAEVACFVPDPPPGAPAPQVDDVKVDARGRILITDRAGGGLYVLERS